MALRTRKLPVLYTPFISVSGFPESFADICAGSYGGTVPGVLMSHLWKQGRAETAIWVDQQFFYLEANCIESL